MRHLKKNIAAVAAAAALVIGTGFVGVQSAAAQTVSPVAATAVQSVPASSVAQVSETAPAAAVTVTAAAPDSTSGHLGIGSPTPGGYVTSPAWVAVGAGIFLLIVWSVSVFGYRRFH